MLCLKIPVLSTYIFQVKSIPVQIPKVHFLMNFEKLILKLILKREWTITAMET